MHRSVRRFALPSVLTLTAVLLVAGVVAALDGASPTDSGGDIVGDEATEAEEARTANLERIADRLDAAEVEADADTLAELADELGVGGAVRALAWADAAGITPDEIAAMRAGDDDTPPMGWGQIRKLLDPDGDLGLHPGIGNVMGNHHGAGKQPDDPGAHGRDRAADARERGDD